MQITLNAKTILKLQIGVNNVKVKVNDLPEMQQRKIKMALKSVGLNMKRVNLYKDGDLITIEVKATGDTFVINVSQFKEGGGNDYFRVFQ